MKVHNNEKTQKIASKKPYNTPKLFCYGDFRDNTLQNSPGAHGIGFQVIKENAPIGDVVPRP